MNILWVPHAPWCTPQRARFFAETLAQRHRVHVTNLDGEFRRPADYLSRRYVQNYFPRQWQENGVTVHHLPRVSPAIFSRKLRELNAAWASRQLARIVAEQKIDVVVGTFVVPVPQGVPLVTDLFDDNVAYWKAYGTNQAYTAEIAAAEDAWIRNSRAVVTVSEVLAERVQARHPAAQVVPIPNSVDLSRYLPDRQAARAALGLSPTKRYVGNIGALDKTEEAERLAAVARALRARPDTELLVVGRGAGMGLLQKLVEREGLGNVRFLGFAAGERLVQLFQALDVGLCPYRATEGANVSVPMRLLHYSAVGANVVCARLEVVERMAFPNVILTDDDDGAFAQGVERALEQPGVRPESIGQYDQGVVTNRYEEVLLAAAGGRP